MKVVSSAVLAAAVVAGLVSVAAAEYITLPIKWSQAPNDPQGGDWTSDAVGQVVADDFACTDPDPIAAIRWWGSYAGEMATPRPTGHTGPFAIGFYYSVPGATAPHPMSLPGERIILYENITAQEEVVGREMNDEFVYRYDAYLPDAFKQWVYSQSRLNGILGELWVSIAKVGEPNWGWEAALITHPTLDYAAYANQGTNWAWQTSGLTDMAYELMTPEPATLALLGVGVVGLAARRRRR